MFLLRCAKSLLHCPVKAVIHNMVSDVLRSHASVHMGVEGVVYAKIAIVVVYPMRPMFFGVVHG